MKREPDRIPPSLYKEMINDLQTSIVLWRKNTFGVPTVDQRTIILSQLTRMAKEVTELMKACQDLEKGDTDFLRECVKKEMCDVLVTMFSAAEELGIDLLEATVNVHWTNMNREWKSNGDGTGQHTKKAPWEIES